MITSSSQSWLEPSRYCVATVMVYWCGVSQHSNEKSISSSSPRSKFTQVDLLNLRIRPVDIHADAVTNQNSDHGLGAVVIENRADANGDPFTARNHAAWRPLSSSRETSRISLDPSPWRLLGSQMWGAYPLVESFLALQHQTRCTYR